jgi:hypothetical protein
VLLRLLHDSFKTKIISKQQLYSVMKLLEIPRNILVDNC